MFAFLSRPSNNTILYKPSNVENAELSFIVSRHILRQKDKSGEMSHYKDLHYLYKYLVYTVAGYRIFLIYCIHAFLCLRQVALAVSLKI